MLKTVVVKRAEACDIYTSVMFGRGLDFSEEQLLWKQLSQWPLRTDLSEITCLFLFVRKLLSQIPKLKSKIDNFTVVCNAVFVRIDIIKLISKRSTVQWPVLKWRYLDQYQTFFGWYPALVGTCVECKLIFYIKIKIIYKKKKLNSIQNNLIHIINCFFSWG